MLDGQWKLVYTSNSELFGLLALSRLPFVTVGDITQTVQASTLTVENKVCPYVLHTSAQSVSAMWPPCHLGHRGLDRREAALLSYARAVFYPEKHLVLCWFVSCILISG